MNAIQPKERVKPTRAKILFVDDEERIVRLLTMIFRRTYTVFSVCSGSAALEIIQREDIHIVVSDQRMPGMTGIQLLSEVRKISPDTVRILLTGYSDLVAIIGAVNEGEVYRFLNKPWDQEELKKVIGECADVALAVQAATDTGAPGGVIETPQLASATKLLALDGVDANRLEIMEMFMEDYSVLGASTIADAKNILGQHDVGVIIADSNVGGEDTTELLRTISIVRPSVTVVVVSSSPDSETIIKLINESRIYRFAMKPLAPNIFRLAVAAAMKEHHRRLADPRLNARISSEAAVRGEKGDLAADIVSSLSRFTKVW